MTDDHAQEPQIPASLEFTRERAEQLLTAACEFQGRAMQARELCRDQFRLKEREEDNNLRILVDGQIASLEPLLSTPITGVNHASSYQIGVVTSYTRTHFLVNDQIMNGDLIEAVTLVRKQLESLARLHELDQKPLNRLEGFTPNVGLFFRHGGGSLYGHLSEVAHFSRPRVSELMHVVEAGERIGPSLHPAFTEHSFACFDMHQFVALYFLFWITQKLEDWYPGIDIKERLALVLYTFSFAKQIGVIQFPDQKDTSSRAPK